MHCKDLSKDGSLLGELVAAPPDAEDVLMPTTSPKDETSKPVPTTTAIEETPRDRLRKLWPLIQMDARGLENVANPITPAQRLFDLWEGNILQAPAVHTATVLQKVMAQLPNADHLLLIPWIGISGGSEKVTQRLLAYLRGQYRYGQLAILAPDSIFDITPMQRLAYGVPIVSLNDFGDLSSLDRMEIVDHVLTNLRPKTAHVINSEAGWDALRQRADAYARDINIFVNVYSDIRLAHRVPAGYFWRYLPEVMPHLAGVFADNAAVIERAVENFSLLPQQKQLFTVVPTPIVGMNGADPLSQCRRYVPVRRKHSLWMSRIAMEKRLDLVREVAVRIPDREFSIYGALLPNAVPHDFLDWTKEMANVEHHGSFRALEALPLDEFDSYLFTTSAEGMPLSILEAAMLGLPIVAPAVGGIGEFIDDTTGWLVPQFDSVEQFAASLEDISARPEEAARRVARSQQRLVDRHSWSNYHNVMSGISNYLVPQDLGE